MIWIILATIMGAWSAPDQLASKITHAFSARDGAPSCAQVSSWGETGAVDQALITIADTISMPPWVPMRAAECVSRNALRDPNSMAAVRRWMVAEETAGFALVVLNALDYLESKSALELGNLALTRAKTDPRFGALAKRTLEASKHKQVVELAVSFNTP